MTVGADVNKAWLLPLFMLLKKIYIRTLTILFLFENSKSFFSDKINNLVFVFLHLFQNKLQKSLKRLFLFRGVNVLNQKSELTRAFEERQRQQFHQPEHDNLPPKSELELALESRRKLSEKVSDSLSRL